MQNCKEVINIFRRIFLFKRINPARRIALGFAAIILIGALLLMLPISSKERVVTPFLTTLFTATSATCVTGLTLVNTGGYFSIFGQFVIITLIQFGGLGFMTILCFMFFVSNKQIGLKNRLMIAQTMGTESIAGVVKLAKHVLVITAFVEGIGAVLLALRFIPKYGFLKGLWFSIFHSISAFCNAGFDIIGDGLSLYSYRHDALVLLTIAFLIIIGGLGFIVWEDILKNKHWKLMSMYSRIVLTATAICLVIGTAGYFLFEYNNPETMGDMTFGGKLISSFFQSTTTRTAGYDALVQNNLTNISKLWGIILMMIGGASGSTAGGVKIGTIVLVFATLMSFLGSKHDVVLSKRRIGHRTIIHAMSLLMMWLILVVLGGSMISLIDGQSIINAMYETASAYSTVGLTVGVSEDASVITKIILIIYMFFGRIGIMTISVMFMTRAGKDKCVRYPDGKFIIG